MKFPVYIFCGPNYCRTLLTERIYIFFFSFYFLHHSTCRRFVFDNKHLRKKLESYWKFWAVSFSWKQGVKNVFFFFFIIIIRSSPLYKHKRNLEHIFLLHFLMFLCSWRLKNMYFLLCVLEYCIFFKLFRASHTRNSRINQI